MIKVQLVRCTASLTFSSISFPDFKFDSCRNYSATLSIEVYRSCKIFITFYCDEFKLENHPVDISLLPGIN